MARRWTRDRDLFDVEPTDRPTLLVVLGLLGLIALIASGIPARRASRANPSLVLNAD